MSIFRLKPIEQVMDNKDNGGLCRTLTAFDLFLMGIGAIVGTGIFVITGVTAAEMSGPAVTLSYLIAGIACIFVALAYTEVASMIPTSGSVYAYAYVSLGEIVAWIIAWMTSLYLVVSASTVASGWSGYMISILKSANIEMPHMLTRGPFEGGLVNLPAMGITALVTLVLIRGTKESNNLNTILVFIKMLAIFLFIVIAIPSFDMSNWFHHYVDYNKSLFASSNFTPFGLEGVFAGAGLVFFGYNGFDALASTAEECKNPEKDLTKAILGSVIACMVLYMLVAGILVGIVPFNELNNASPLSYALSKIGSNLGSAIVGSGALTGMTTVILVQTYAQTRIFYVMSRDGLIPKIFSKVHPKFHTPHISTLTIGGCVMLISGLVPLTIMGSVASLGSLFSFVMVSIIMLVLRKKFPQIQRPFKCPTPYLVAGLAITLCSYLIYTLLLKVGVYFIVWLFIGISIYFLYVRKNIIWQSV
jgi:basic amino acid/polyamine antiporter, APA family